MLDTIPTNPGPVAHVQQGDNHRADAWNNSNLLILFWRLRSRSEEQADGDVGLLPSAVAIEPKQSVPRGSKVQP